MREKKLSMLDMHSDMQMQQAIPFCRNLIVATQTLSRVSHVLRVNLLSSVKNTWWQWQTCQFWCSMTNANQAPWCWAVTEGLTRWCWSVAGHLHEVWFWLFDQRHSHQCPAGGHYVGLWQCSSCTSLHKGADIGPADGLRTFYGPVLS